MRKIVEEFSEEDEEDEADGWPGRAEPATVRRKCTDVGWLVPLVLCTGVVAVLTVVGIPHSDPHRLAHYMDYKGKLCSQGDNLNKTVSFYCLAEGSDDVINLLYPVCRESCPNGSDTNYTCKHQGINPKTNKTKLVKYLMNDYPTFIFSGGLACAPVARNMTLEVWKWQRRNDSFKNTLFLYFRMLAFAWEPIALAGVFAVFASYAYLLMVRYFARTLVWTGIILLAVVPLGFGSSVVWCLEGGPEFTCDLSLRNEDFSVGDQVNAKYFGKWYPAQIESVDPNSMYTIMWSDGNYTEQKHRYDLKVGQTQASATPNNYRLMVGVAYILIGSMFTMFLFTQAGKVDMAISCLEWAFRVILTTPSLMMHPVMTIALRLVIVFWFLTVGRHITSLFALDIVTPKDEYSGGDVAIAMFFVFTFWWLMHWCAAVSHFVVMYTTQVWYFNGGLRKDMGQVVIPRFLAAKAMGVCFRYHLGSMALGSLACSLSFPFRFVLGLMTGVARMDGNPIGRMIGACCCCCVSLYEGVFGPIGRNAYLEVVRSSRPFMESAWLSQDILDDDDTVHLLNGATFLFQALGVGIIGTLGNMLTQFAVKFGINGKDFNEERDAWYVFNPSAEAFAGTCVAVFVATPFMMLFDIVSDTVLYCYTVEGLWQVEDEPVLQETWTDGIRSYVSELIGCTCSWRPNKLVAAPGLPMPADGYYAEVAGHEDDGANRGSGGSGGGRGGGGGGGSASSKSRREGSSRWDGERGSIARELSDEETALRATASGPGRPGMNAANKGSGKGMPGKGANIAEDQAPRATR